MEGVVLLGVAPSTVPGMVDVACGSLHLSYFSLGNRALGFEVRLNTVNLMSDSGRIAVGWA
jgi:hypothetical protein